MKNKTSNEVCNDVSAASNNDTLTTGERIMKDTANGPTKKNTVQKKGKTKGTAPSDLPLSGPHEAPEDTLWKKKMSEIHEGIAACEKLPTILNELFDLADTLDKKHGLAMVLGFVVDVLEKIDSSSENPKVNVRRFKDTISELIAQVCKTDAFNLSDVELCEAGRVLSELQKRYEKTCKRIKQAAKGVRAKLLREAGK